MRHEWSGEPDEAGVEWRGWSCQNEVETIERVRREEIGWVMRIGVGSLVGHEWRRSW